MYLVRYSTVSLHTSPDALYLFIFPGEHLVQRLNIEGYFVLVLSTCFSQTTTRRHRHRQRFSQKGNMKIMLEVTFDSCYFLVILQKNEWQVTTRWKFSEKVTMGWSWLCTNSVSARVTWPSLSVSQWSNMSSPILSQNLISIQLWDCSAEISSNNGRVLNTKIMSSSSVLIQINIFNRGQSSHLVER